MSETTGEGRTGGFYDALTAEERAALGGFGTRRRFRRGTTLFNEGDSSDWIAIVLEGLVKVSCFTDDGREILLAVRGDNELIGELSAIDHKPRSAGATALEDVSALVVTAEAFRAFLEAHPRAAIVLLEMVGKRLREADTKRIQFGASDTAGRVAARLVELAEAFGERTGEGAIVISLSLSQEDLAGWTGASREAVSKALRTFRSRGWIETHRRAITILDLEALRRRADRA